MSSASSRTEAAWPRFSPTAAAPRAICWWRPTAYCRRCGPNSCPRSGRATPAMSAGAGTAGHRALPRETQDLIAGRIVACFPEGEMMLTMPVPGTGEDMRPGHRRCYFIWYRPADEAALADLFTDAAGRHHGAAIPPPLIRPEFIRAMKARAAAVFAPPVAAVVARTAQPLLQAITDLECPRLVFGRVVLTGDAGFVARPHVAAGVTKAALDAECLVDSLASSGGDIAAGL